MEVESVLPEERGNWQLATLMAMYGNAHRDQGRRPVPFEAADFMPGEHKPAARPMTRDEWQNWKDSWKAGGVPLDPKTGHRLGKADTDKVKGTG